METNVGMLQQAKKPSLFGMIASPSVQFERMKGKTSLALPMVVMLILQAILGGAIAYLASKDPAVLEMQKDLPSDFEVPVAVTVGFGAGGAAVAALVMYFIMAAFYKIMMVFMGNDTPYGKLLAISVYTSIIGVVGIAINILLMFAFGGYEPTYTSLAPLFEKGTVLYGIASAFEVFSIWSLVVTALGLRIVAGLSNKQATTVVIVIFLITLAFTSASSFIPQP
ncbi:MAG: Yip1 family protein [Ectobacillus sp.]